VSPTASLRPVLACLPGRGSVPICRRGSPWRSRDAHARLHRGHNDRD
jgi:hypothetical protein